MNKKGFTLVELLAVIVILSLIITVVATKGFGAFNSAREKISAENEKTIYEAANVFSLDINYCEQIADENSIKKFFDMFDDSALGFDLNCNKYLKIKNIIKQKGITSDNFEGFVTGSDLNVDEKNLLQDVKDKGLINTDEINIKICFDIPLTYLIDSNYLENDGVLEISKNYPDFKINTCNEIITDKIHINLNKGPTISEIENSLNVIYVDYIQGQDTNNGSYYSPVKSLKQAFDLSNNNENVEIISLKSNYVFENVETMENNNNIILEGNNNTIEFKNVADEYYIKNNNELIINNLNFKNGGRILYNYTDKVLKINNIKVSNLVHTFLYNLGESDINSSKFIDNYFLFDKDNDYINGGMIFHKKVILYNGSKMNIINSLFQNNEYETDILYDTILTLNEKNYLSGSADALCIINNSLLNINNTNFKDNNINKLNRPLIYSKNMKVEDSNFINNIITIHNYYKNVNGISSTSINYYLIDVYEDFEFNNVTFENNQQQVIDNGVAYVPNVIANETAIIHHWHKALINNSIIQNNKLNYITKRYIGAYDLSRDYFKINNTKILNNEVDSMSMLFDIPMEIKDSVIENNKYETWFFYFNGVTTENRIINTQIKNNLGGVDYPYDPLMFFTVSNDAILTIDSNSLVCGNKSDTGSYINNSYGGYGKGFKEYSNNGIVRDEC